MSTEREHKRVLAGAVVAAVLAALPAPAAAQAAGDEHVYVVEPGDTLTRIAARLEVSPVALAERNHLSRPYALRVGRRLRLPDGVPADVARDLPTRAHAATRPAARASDNDDDSGDGPAAAPHRSGFVTLSRQRDGAVLATNLANGNQSLRVRMERFLRFRDGSRHGVHPRLIRQLAALGDHFPGRRIVVLSGFRPQPRSHTGPRTRHSQGYAVDLRVEGVSLRSVFSFCETLEDVGCGFYPRAGFVHLDVRRESAAWTDNAVPGAHTRSRPVPDSDETIAETLEDAAPVRDRDASDQ